MPNPQIKAIQALVRDARPGDVFVFHCMSYSHSIGRRNDLDRVSSDAGHTDQREAVNDKDEEDGLDEG